MRTSQKLLVSLGLVVATAACGDGRITNGNGDDDGGGTGIDAPTRPDASPVPPIPPECLDSANRGLAWLVTQQQADGAWGANYRVAATGFAVLKLETYAGEIGMSPFDPNFIYAAEVMRGLNFLFGQAQIVGISAQLAGNPDTNGNGTGIEFSSLMYENSIALMAIVAGSEPDRLVTLPGSAVHRFTYHDVAQEATDYLSFAQSDSASWSGSCTKGGWRYSPFDNNPSAGDNSVSQWAVLALEYARHPNYNYQLSIPNWVSTELREWVTCIQNHGGGANDGAAGYTQNDQILNSYKTGALVEQSSFLGDAATTPNVVAALAYLSRMWADTSGAGWRMSPTSNYLAMYSIMKGMESMAISDLNGIDWYRDFCDQLMAEQNADGSWPASQYEYEPVGNAGILSTEWALLVLERAAPPPEIVN